MPGLKTRLPNGAWLAQAAGVRTRLVLSNAPLVLPKGGPPVRAPAEPQNDRLTRRAPVQPLLVSLGSKAKSDLSVKEL